MKTPKKAPQSELFIAQSKIDDADYCISVKRASNTYTDIGRTHMIVRFICKCARTMTRLDFDTMMDDNGNMVKNLDDTLHYRFGITMVSRYFVDDVFANPDDYEKMFKNG